MKEFLESSTHILKRVRELRKITKEIEEAIRMKQTSVLAEDKELALDRRMDYLDTSFDETCHEIKDAIKSTREETDRLTTSGDLSKEELEVRNMHIYKYYKELSDAIFAYRNLKSEYKNREKELLKQAFQIVNPKASDADIEKTIENPDSEMSAGSAFSLGTNSGQQILKQAKYRRKKIDKIVETIGRLIALIDEIDELVHKNTKVVDEVVVNVTKAEMNTRQANKELESALIYQRRLNFVKRLVFALVIVAIFVVLLVLVIKNGSSLNTGGSRMTGS